MKSRLWMVPGLAILASCAAFTGDDSTSIEPSVEAPDAAVPSAETDAGTPAVVVPPTQDSDAGPEVDAAPNDVDAAPPPVDELTEAYGLFVSLAGTPDGAGTRESPISSITTAIGKAKLANKRVYVCKGTYKESLALKSGVSVLGGYGCTAGWKASSGEYSRLESPAIPAVTAQNITDATVFSGFDVVAPNGSAGQMSSIGLLATNATKLVVSKAKITAGTGFAGAAGTTPPAATPGGNVNGQKGVGAHRYSGDDTKPPPSWQAGGAGGTSACGGGKGGDGGDGGYVKCKGTVNPPPNGNGEVVYTTTIATCLIDLQRSAPCSSQPPGGGTSADGTAGTDGVSGGGMGTLSAAGYTPRDGTAGTSGAPGAGGKGGDAQSDTNACHQIDGVITLASGSGGGAGGCAGVAGTPGKGGGASIAALVWSSPGLVFDGAAFTAGDGGAGGRGSLGALPTSGGSSPLIIPVGTGGGNNGGDGGRAGVSGSGAGGPSLGIAYHGEAPQLIGGTTAKCGKGGAGVAADSASFNGKTWSLPASAAGLARDLYTF